MDRALEYRQLLDEEATCDTELTALAEQMAALRTRKAVARQRRKELDDNVPVQFRLLLTHFKAMGAEEFDEAALMFGLSKEEMNQRWLTFVLVICANLQVSRHYHPSLDATFKATQKMFEEAAQHQPLTKQPWQVEIGLLNYVNKLSHPDKARDIARVISCFSHCLDTNWGAGWINHGFTAAQEELPGYRKIVKAQAKLLTLLPVVA